MNRPKKRKNVVPFKTIRRRSGATANVMTVDRAWDENYAVEHAAGVAAYSDHPSLEAYARAQLAVVQPITAKNIMGYLDAFRAAIRKDLAALNEFIKHEVPTTTRSALTDLARDRLDALTGRTKL